MDWMQISISTTTDGIESVSGRLYQIGINGLEIEDAADFNDFLENSKQYWDYVDDDLMAKSTAPTVIKLYLEKNASGMEMLGAVRQTLSELKSMDADGKYGSLESTAANMREQDWAENWKQYYKPLCVGKSILICPEWEQPDNTDGKTIFTINPGMSFGTGTHQSTQLCIENLEKHIKKGDSVIDLGCGSGILSIIAMLLGADHSVAIDIDPDAAKTALENAQKNNISMDKYKTYAGNVVSDKDLLSKVSTEKYDIVLANIVADVIIAISPTAKSLLKPGGTFITSGIINSRTDEVAAAISYAGFKIIDTIQKGEWSAIVAQ